MALLHSGQRLTQLALRALQTFDLAVDRTNHFFIFASDAFKRTTFTLDDDAAALAQNFARASSLRLGQAVSEPIRRASAPPLTLKNKGPTVGDCRHTGRA